MAQRPCQALRDNVSRLQQDLQELEDLSSDAAAREKKRLRQAVGALTRDLSLARAALRNCVLDALDTTRAAEDVTSAESAAESDS